MKYFNLAMLAFNAVMFGFFARCVGWDFLTDNQRLVCVLLMALNAGCAAMAGYNFVVRVHEEFSRGRLLQKIDHPEDEGAPESRSEVRGVRPVQDLPNTQDGVQRQRAKEDPRRR